MPLPPPCEIHFDRNQYFETYLNSQSFRKEHPTYKKWIYNEPMYTQKDCLSKEENITTITYSFTLPANLSRYEIQYEFDLPLQVSRSGTGMILIPNPEELIRRAEKLPETVELIRKTESVGSQITGKIGFDYLEPQRHGANVYYWGHNGEFTVYSTGEKYSFSPLEQWKKVPLIRDVYSLIQPLELKAGCEMVNTSALTRIDFDTTPVSPNTDEAVFQISDIGIECTNDQGQKIFHQSYPYLFVNLVTGDVQMKIQPFSDDTSMVSHIKLSPQDLQKFKSVYAHEHAEESSFFCTYFSWVCGFF
jgi:hypothetical protein